MFAKGGEGGKALAQQVLQILEDRPIQYTYPLDMPLKQKIEAVATKIYRADGVKQRGSLQDPGRTDRDGVRRSTVCIAKTQYSFLSDNAKLLAAPTGFTMEVREVRLSAGAGFVVVICGSVSDHARSAQAPAAVGIDVDDEGRMSGLF